jgi:hypothetical protein
MADEDPSILEEESEQRRSLQRVVSRRGIVILFAIFAIILIVLFTTISGYPGIVYSTEARADFFRVHYATVILIGTLTVAVTSTIYLFAGNVGGDFRLGNILNLRFASSVLPTPNYDAVPASQRRIVKFRTTLSDIDIYRSFLERMSEDETRLKGNSILNLVSGLTFAVLGFGVLSIPLLIPDSKGSDIYDFIIHYLPKVALGALIQLIAFFFLRLYSANQQDLKHNKNEITNVDMWMLSLTVVQTEKNVVEIARVLSRTERNFVLRKGERTVATDNTLEYNDVKDLLERAIGLARQQPSPSPPRTGKPTAPTA